MKKDEPTNISESKIKHLIYDSQLELFSYNREDFLRIVGADTSRLKLWYQFNILSFDPEKIEKFYQKDIIEARFVKTIMESGLPFEQIVLMLNKLEKPYIYSFDEIYWDLEKKRMDFDRKNC